MNKRLLCFMASLLLCGAVSAQTHFTAPDAHAKSGNTPIVAAVTVDNAAPATGAELAVYVGNELRGLATSEEFVDGNFWVQVYYNTGDTETLTFKLWNPAGEGAELDTYTLTYDDLTELTTSEEGYGTPSAPVEVSFNNSPTQQTSMTQGWNWWSSYVEITDGASALTMLENSMGTSGEKISSFTNGDVEYYDFNGGLWYGTLNSICNEQMYKVKTNAPFTCELNGNAANPSSHPIPINENWNWIGFPYNHEVGFEDAMSGFTPSHLDEIKNLNGDYSQYYITTNFTGWYGTLTTLEPGKGYKYKSTSSESKTLVYQTNRRESVIKDKQNKPSIFNIDDIAFSDNMTITAVVDLEGRELSEDGYELAAFVDNECRGSVKLMYVEPIDRYVAFLSVVGDSEASLRFVLTNGNGISWSNDHLIYTVDAIIGNLFEPYILHFGSLGLNDNVDNLVKVYPNPSNDIFNIEGSGIRKVDIINIYGQIIYSKNTREDNLQIDLSNYSIGTYILRVVTDGGVSTKQLIKK